MRRAIKDGWRLGILPLLPLLVFGQPGLAQLFLDLADTISFDSSGFLDNHEEIGVTLTVDKLNLSSQATFALEHFQGVSVMAKVALGDVDFNVHTSFDQDGFKGGNLRTRLRVKGLSLEGVTTFGVAGLERGRLKADLKFGQLALRSQASLQAMTLTGLTTMISYRRNFGGYHLTSITRFNRLNFTTETLVLRVLMDNLALGNSWIITPRGWTGDVLQVEGDLGMLHLASLASWGTRGLEEGRVELRAVINKLRLKSTLRFSPEGFMSWSSLARMAWDGFDLRGALFLTDKGFQGRFKASTALENIEFQSELEFNKAGLQRVTLKGAAEIDIINLSSILSFSSRGVRGEIRTAMVGFPVSSPKRMMSDGGYQG